MIVGGYTAHFYCDEPGAVHGYKAMPLEAYGRNMTQCLKIAKAAGWAFNKGDDGDTISTCPDCIEPRKLRLRAERLAFFAAYEAEKQGRKGENET